MVPTIGAKAPAFTLPRDGGGTVSLADFKGRKLVLYFYPKADTPGCTKESIAFSGLQRAFAKADTDATLKANLALLLGSLRPGARVTGERLLRYQPAAPAPPPREK